MHSTTGSSQATPSRWAYCLSVVLALGCGICHAAPPLDVVNPLEVVTEHWPPYNYELDGQLTGLGTEIVQATLDEANIEYTIRLGVWKGIYARAKSEANILIYTLVRNEEREQKFEWIGPIAERQQSFYSLSSRDDIVINRLEDARPYRIGLQASDAITQELRASGFNEHNSHLKIFPKRVLTYRMLLAGRIDLITGNALATKYQLQLENIPLDRIKPVFQISVPGAYYMAFKKGSNPQLIRAVRKGFEGIKAQGKLQDIHRKYN